ncbi:hypothetical protein ACFPPA_09710 [Rhodanobacter ginsengisoli]|uniref:Uncharacterized protein n=1 Tax=Rhodanobacter ginsengisoli TaxID=418646 RepID=A0ABW0QMK4_9GAMM
MQLAAACYPINSFALLPAPAFEGGIFPAILLPCLIAEPSFALWLMLKGVNVTEWTKRADASPAIASPTEI